MTRGPKPAGIHGTRAEYARGCRCRPCRDAAAAAAREWRQRQRVAGSRFVKGYRVAPSDDVDDDLPVPPTATGNWADNAGCRGHSRDMFFPSRGESTAPAKQVCAGCSVRVDCLDYALTNGIHHGIWGGLSERERRRMRRHLRLAAAS